MSDKDRKSVFIITGETGSGKTTYLLKMIEELKRKASSIAGFAALSIPGDGASGSYNILDLVSGKILSLATRGFNEGWEQIGNFYFNPAGIQMGKEILEDPLIINNDLIVVDEIGPFELDGKVWAESLTRLLGRQCCSILLVVREQLVSRVIQQWSLKDTTIIEIGQTQPDQIATEILSQTIGK